MRGLQDGQTGMWAFVSIEERIPSDHPLRGLSRWPIKSLRSCRGCLTDVSKWDDRRWRREDTEVAVVDRTVLGEERAAIQRAVGLQFVVSLVFGHGA